MSHAVNLIELCSQLTWTTFATKFNAFIWKAYLRYPALHSDGLGLIPAGLCLIPACTIWLEILHKFLKWYCLLLTQAYGLWVINWWINWPIKDVSFPIHYIDSHDQCLNGSTGVGKLLQMRLGKVYNIYSWPFYYSSHVKYK